MFDFPASPSNGQMFTPVAGGPSYVFQTPVWRLAPGGVNSGVWVGDAPPSSPSQGTLWWESDSGNTFIYYDDGSSQQWVQFNSAPPPAGFMPITAQARNRIVNPAMQISQELGDTGTGASSAYFADQWQFVFIGPTCGANRNSSVAASPNGTLTRAGLNINTAKGSLASGDQAGLFTPIEGIHLRDLQWGTAAAKQVVLQFVARVTTTPGTYGVSIRNGALNRAWLGSFSVPAVNTDYLITMVIPGDTTGTWPKDNTLGMYVGFTFAAGTGVQGVPGWQAGNLLAPAGVTNGAAATGALLITDVGLYLDSQATGLAPPWQMPDEAEQLRACQRYWQKASTSLDGNMTSGVTYSGYGSLALPMRTTPTLSAVNVSASGFPATPSLGFTAPNMLFDSRTCNATGRALMRADVTANARM